MYGLGADKPDPTGPKPLDNSAYGDVIKIEAPGRAKPGGISTNGFWSSVDNALRLYNQQRLENENMRRSQDGQTPISYERDDAGGFVLDDQTRNNGIALIVLGIGAFLLLSGGRRGAPALGVED